MNADDIPQSERRRIIAEDRRGQTFQGRAIAELGDVGGRFASEIRQSVTASSPSSIYPQQPEHSPWRRDDCPPEPPLGFSVEEQPTTGEVFEVRSSLAASVAGDESRKPQSDSQDDAGLPAQQSEE